MFDRFALPVFALATFFSLSASAAEDGPPPGRLSAAARPVAYALDLTILPDQDEFTGRAAITVEIAAPTRVLYLHGNGLTVRSAAFEPRGGRSQAGTWTAMDATGVARLEFATPVPAGAGTLRFDYTAPFGKAGAGLYKSEIAGEAYTFTQFQPIDARRMFPGFDEPGFKTPFDIAVTTRTANAVVGNTPIVAEQPAGEGLKRVQLATTLPLPTYLIALAVGPLDIVDGAPVPPNGARRTPLPLRGVATRGKGPRLRYALENTHALVLYLEDYFGVPFPYPKLDLIASPDFGGGMENAGAIIYGDPRLLLADDASVADRRGFGGIHAHELAHQWFGDLVTPKWWDDIWLNESFANWMGFKAGNAWQPALRFDVVPALQTPAAMELDSRIAARQIRQPVTRNADIGSAFDAITYLKGGAVLGMFESWLGEDGFRAGNRTHMKRFPHGVADVEDYMASLAKGSGRADVVPAFRSFIDQPGVPLVTAKLECGDGTATLRVNQSRYLPVGSRGNPQQAWQLPVCVRHGTGDVSGKDCALVTTPEATIRLDTTSCPAWAMPNADGAGYYRFALDPAGWQALEANFDRLNELEALAAADSLSAAYQANRLTTSEFLAVIGTLAKSRYPQVALAPGKDLVRLRDYVAPAREREKLNARMRELYRPRLAAFGPDPLKAPPAVIPETAEAVDNSLFRVNLIRLLALDAEDTALRGALAEAAARYIRLRDQPGGQAFAPDESAVEPALRETALRAGVQHQGRPFADALISRLLSSNDILFRSQAALALGTTDDPAVGRRVRELLLDPQLRAREPTTIAFALAARPSQRRATFDWFKANHEAFIARTSTFGYRWLPRFGAGFCSKTERDELAAFFTPLLPRLDGADRTLNETLEGIELCAALGEVKRGEWTS
ncbi:MAG: M1 family metallopeptidase [Chromatiales bacterium]|nr:M1 family metallopeptidase [Chromatiales bacterium]